MAIAFGLSGTNVQTSGLTVTLTIPAVSSGDLVVVLGLANNVATTLTLTSTGTTPTAISPTPVMLTSTAHGAWQFTASGTDSGKVLTLTTNGATGKLAIALVSYTGVLTSAPVDVVAESDDHLSATFTHVTPTLTTVTDQDWIIQGLTCKETDTATPPTWTVPGTQRAFAAGAAGGGNPNAILTDGNAAVSSGTLQGGGSFVQGQSITTAAAVKWAIAVSPASSGTNATVTMGSFLAVTTAQPAAAVSGSLTPAVLAAASAQPAAALSGSLTAATLAVATSKPAPSVTAGGNAQVTMGSFLAVAAAQPAVQAGSLSGPAYASAVDTTALAGTGTWTSPGSAEGAPDGSYATWAVV